MRVFSICKVTPAVMVFCAVGVMPTLAQVVHSNAAGIVMVHAHLLVRDFDANRNFFLALGGTPATNGPFEMIRFPGATIMLRQGEPTQGTLGSVINHIGFLVQNMQESVSRWQSAGITIEPGIRPAQKWITSPDGVRIEIIEDTSIPVPIMWSHLHYFLPQTLKMQAWYEKTFGAVSEKRGQIDSAGKIYEVDSLPGTRMNFTKLDSDQSPTKERALDHIGFEVKNLEAFCRKLKASGVKFDSAYRKLPNSNVATAFFTDPWGTYIELTEGLTSSSE